MANFGKFKIDRSEGGLNFRFGNGKGFRIGGRGNADPSDYDEDMYRGDYADEDGYYEDEDRPEDYNDYSEKDDYYYEDDRGDNYSDDDYADDDYNDRYQDEDADGYPAEDDYADESPLMRFLDENDWVTYALLVLLPPLGVWLLWRRRRFDPPIRMAVSGVSILWFVVLLVLLFSRILSGSGDTTISGNITMTTPVPTVSAAATVKPDTTSSLSFGDDFMGTDGNITDPEAAEDDLAAALAPDITPVPAATALPGANGAVAANSVYMTATGMYYHNNVSCEQLNDGSSVSTVTTDVAIERGKSPCPVCYPDQKVFYATEKGKYYHSTADCSGMTDATTITEEAAKSKGKTACPVCITGEVTSLGKVKFVDSNTKDKSGINVYATKEGKYFHTQSTCSGMKNPSTISLLNAMLSGKSPCPNCAKAAGSKVWCTKTGKYYHNKSNCSGMEGAYQVTLAEALVLGKKRCSECWAGSTGGVFTSNAEAGQNTETSLTSSNGTVYVYATKGGKHYHTNATCSGMSGASRITMKDAIKAGKTACPTCCAGADAKAYVTSKGTYYHSKADCSGMKDAKETTVAQAIAQGYKRCTECWGASVTGATGTGNTSTVYATKGGKYYHTNATCSGMKDAQAMTLEQAVRSGKTACSTCASAAKRTVYSTDDGKYYHSDKTCGGMKGASARTLEQAVLKGQTACPKCVGTAQASKITGTGKLKKSKIKKYVTKSKKLTRVKSSSFSKSTLKKAKIKVAKSAVTKAIKSGKSGVKVYATRSGKYYHTSKAHAGAAASRITLETALKYGKTACKVCSKSAGRTVYATRGGKYYHFYKAHAGKNSYGGKLSYALALGLDPCPVCVKYTKAKIGGVAKKANYRSGASGIKVYAVITGKHYHVSKACAGAGAAHISLETAMNYGKTACPTCTSLAKKTVYARSGSKYYHSSKSHAGAGAVHGTLASAMASGMKACPTCILGSEAYEHSDIKYSAAADTAVYVDPGSELAYYHRTKKCSDADMKKGTRVQLEFVIKWGFKACPYCNPPTSVSK